MKQSIRIALLCMAVLVMARAGQAQTVGLADDARAGLIGASGYVGFEFDVPDHALLVGADGRVKFGALNLEINPRFTFRPFADGSMQQVDVNFLTNYRLNNPGRFRPYSGLGLGFHSIHVDDFGSANDVGINLISGVRLAMRPGAAYEPFLQAQYTVLKQPSNSFTLTFGATFSFR